MKKTIFLIIGILVFVNVSVASADSTITRQIHKNFQLMCSDGKFSGNVLVAIHDQIIFESSCGVANRSFNVPNNLKTKFNLGSVGKLFTSISIAQLIQKNKLSLDSKAYQFIPLWITYKHDKNITIEQLLIHTAGLGNFMDDKRWKMGADSGLYVAVNDYKPLVHDDKRLFDPGDSQSYSNNGYVLLGAVIESLSNQNYINYIKQNIFDVANMKDTGIWSLDDPIYNRAEGYFSVCEKSKCYWKNNNFATPFVGSPAGGAYSTVEDMFQFSKALHSNKLLNQKLTGEVFSTDIVNSKKVSQLKSYKIGTTSVNGNFSQYGFSGAWNKFGFAVWNNPFLVGHTGGTKGASAFFAMSPDDQYTIIILSNIDGDGPILLYKKIREALGISAKIDNY